MTITKQVRLSAKGQLVIPKEMREALGLVEGDQLLATLDGERILIVRPEHFARSTRGILKGTWGRTRKDLTRYLNRERRSWE
ncbi:MAG TPA: AbrB/MazE/SpoVT family DNA-binding domain-containing protein [Vicinamibacteria bacterium]|nr:AbrB/MazE/SpoVT family DNA-binding domain-containing protein [Vicinamibacteria bacterium]